MGITQKTIHTRFNKNNILPYNYEVIGSISGNLFESFKIEQLSKKQLRKLRYKPKIKFDGHTECFKLDALDELLQLTGINRDNMEELL